MKQEIKRKDLLSIVLDQSLSNIEIKEVSIPIGGKGAYHLHPCPVIGYVSQGEVLFQIEGKKAQTLSAGSVFYEPKNTPILHFDNASSSESLIFIAFYLREEREDFITIL